MISDYKKGVTMKIITISREFGSGGRELGKRLAETLGFDYYDQEILAEIAKNKGMDDSYVERLLENQGWRDIPLTHHGSFGIFIQPVDVDVLLEQKRVIEEIAKVGRDCVIIGRNADAILSEYQPLSIFVCADMESKIRRCKERAPKGENLTEKELIRKIKRVDKNRARTREIITGGVWGENKTYHFCINTASWTIEDLTPALAAFTKSWFERSNR